VAKYIVRRLLATIPVLFGLSIVLFTFVHLLPGDPATALLGQHATPELVAKIRTQLGLDKPLYEQYLTYIGQVVRGDFGRSILDNRPILDEFLTRFPGTIELTMGALIFAVGLGIPLGRFGARHVQGPGDGMVTVLSLLGVSIPIFVLGYALQYLFSVTLHWLPTSSSLDPRLLNFVPPVTHFVLIDTLLAGRGDAFVDALRHLILPSIALGSIPLAIITRITRASVLDVNNEDYVRTARAKGLRERRVDSRHIMRNAWLPVVTVIGLQVGGLLAGAVITETIFTWDGVGRWAVQAIQGHDYIVVQSVITIYAFIFNIVNLIVDVGYAFLNPRIRYA
jgi:peptide/nickel transport system permease protein